MPRKRDTKNEITEEEIEGGVFAPPRKRKVLFTKKIKVSMDDLPRLYPRVTEEDFEKLREINRDIDKLEKKNKARLKRLGIQ